MKISCPNCSSQYDVASDLIPDGGRQVLCSVCDTQWHVERQDDDAENIDLDTDQMDQVAPKNAPSRIAANSNEDPTPEQAKKLRDELRRERLRKRSENLNSAEAVGAIAATIEQVETAEIANEIEALEDDATVDILAEISAEDLSATPVNYNVESESELLTVSAAVDDLSRRIKKQRGERVAEPDAKPESDEEIEAPFLDDADIFGENWDHAIVGQEGSALLAPVADQVESVGVELSKLSVDLPEISEFHGADTAAPNPAPNAAASEVEVAISTDDFYSINEDDVVAASGAVPQLRLIDDVGDEAIAEVADKPANASANYIGEYVEQEPSMASRIATGFLFAIATVLVVVLLRLVLPQVATSIALLSGISDAYVQFYDQVADQLGSLF